MEAHQNRAKRSIPIAQQVTRQHDGQPLTIEAEHCGVRSPFGVPVCRIDLRQGCHRLASCKWARCSLPKHNFSAINNGTATGKNARRARLLWERPCVAKGVRSAPRIFALSQDFRGRFAAPSRSKAAPTDTAHALSLVQYLCALAARDWAAQRPQPWVTIPPFPRLSDSTPTGHPCVCFIPPTGTWAKACTARNATSNTPASSTGCSASCACASPMRC